MFHHQCQYSASLVLLLGLCFAPVLSAQEPESRDVSPASERGAEIYRTSCASCHGDRGLGVEDAYDKPLVGDASIGELAGLVSETMPEDDPESCAGKDAHAVATFIHGAFYSVAAQAKLNPPRVRLGRLTATQLRQSLADLYGRFGSPLGHNRELGIRARYYNLDKKEDGKEEVDRIDPMIDFDFGHDPPAAGINASNFSIQWNGAMKAGSTGRYEFVVRSTGAFLFYLGDDKREFINNYVQSAEKTEFRKTIQLTAGRVYPFSIRFYQRKRKTEQPPAKISLSWIRPHGVEQLVSARNFVNVDAPATFSLQTKLPPDDRSYGYERGITVDRQWDESTTAAAIEFADQAIAELWPRYRARHKDLADENRNRLRSFLTELAETAFRGPLNDELRKLYIDNQVQKTDDDAEAIKRVMLIVLKSPRFLYPLIDRPRSKSQRAANRLVLNLFDSLPSDEWLRNEVAANGLENEDQLRDAAGRMVDDWRARGKTKQFLFEWLNLGQLEEVTKEKELFPGFDEGLVSDLRESLDAFLDEVVWSNESDYRQLMLADWSFTTPRIKEFYGDAWKPADGGKGLVPTGSGFANRFGVLSHPYVMSGLAYRDSTSPIHRGVFLFRYVLGRTLRPPNAAFVPLSPDLHPDLTTRERVTLQTSPDDCQACHAKINGLGFVLEKFDAVGRYQSMERGRAIDASGRYTTRLDETVKFRGPRDLANYLATSRDAHRAFVNRAFQYFVKQPPAAYGLDTEDRLLKSFEQKDFNIRKLLIEIAVVAATTTENTDKREPGKRDS